LPPEAHPQVLTRDETRRTHPTEQHSEEIRPTPRPPGQARHQVYDLRKALDDRQRELVSAELQANSKTYAAVTRKIADANTQLQRTIADIQSIGDTMATVTGDHWFPGPIAAIGHGMISAIALSGHSGAGPLAAGRSSPASSPTNTRALPKARLGAEAPSFGPGEH